MRWPGTKTLSDFRADRALLEAESEALVAAKRWITPHRAIAKLGGERSVLLDWAMPKAQARRGDAVVFPASTLSRKGARELREAIRGEDVTLRLLGPVLEEEGFWKGLKVQPVAEDWLDGAGVVVLPAWVEQQPRRLLRALSAGIPVVCTAACGVAARPGLTLVEEGDVVGLRSAIREALASGGRE
jgi:glycosyltransferase involved in cell wall biosynthesis